MNLIRMTDRVALAYARAFACLSAANISKPTDTQIVQLVKLLDQDMYLPLHFDPGDDCRVYIAAWRGEDRNEHWYYVPSWARAGVRYLRPNIDILQLDPSDWWRGWFDIYEATFPDLEPESQYGKLFTKRLESLGEDEDYIRAMTENNRLVVDRDKIKKLVPLMDHPQHGGPGYSAK
jgi:hypothetical protein